MRKTIKTVSILLFLTMPLTACLGREQKLNLAEVSKTIPDYVLTCQEDPAVPARGPNGQRDGKTTSDYTTDLWEAGEDCRTKLATVKQSLGR